MQRRLIPSIMLIVPPIMLIVPLFIVGMVATLRDAGSTAHAQTTPDQPEQRLSAYLPLVLTVPAVQDCSSTIGFGETITCGLDAAGETDAYTFEATGVSSVLLRLTRTSGTHLPGLRIVDEAAAQVCQQGARDSKTAMIEATCRLPHAGTYTIQVADASDTRNGTGEYRLYVQNLNKPGLATPMALGESQADRQDTHDAIDTYTFAATRGDHIFLSVTQKAGIFAFPLIRVYAPDGNLACTMIPLYGPDERFYAYRCAISQSGRHTVLLASDTHARSALSYYQFYVQSFTQPERTTPLALGQSTIGIVTQGQAVSAHTMTLTANNRIVLRSIGTADTLFRPFLRLYSPTGIAACTELILNPDSGPTETTCDISRTGTYLLVVSDASEAMTATGTYRVFAQNLTHPVPERRLSTGQTVAGTISPAGDMEVIKFTSTRDAKVFLRATGTSERKMRPWIRVYNRDNSLVCDSDNEEWVSEPVVEMICTTPIRGDYTILLVDATEQETSYRGSGDYQLYLHHLDQAEDIPTIGFGQTSAGELNTPGKIDTYTFAANKDDLILVRLSMGTGTPALPWIRVYTTGGWVLCENEPMLRPSPPLGPVDDIWCSIHERGIYTIFVADGSEIRTHTGAYRLYIQRLNNVGMATPIANGQTRIGEIDPGTDIDTYVFTTESYLNATIRLTRTSGNLQPEVRVRGPDGNPRCSQYSSDPDTDPIEFTCTYLDGGTYSIFVSNLLTNPDTIGQYRLTLEQP